MGAGRALPPRGDSPGAGAWRCRIIPRMRSAALAVALAVLASLSLTGCERDHVKCVFYTEENNAHPAYRYQQGMDQYC